MQDKIVKIIEEQLGVETIVLSRRLLLLTILVRIVWILLSL